MKKRIVLRLISLIVIFTFMLDIVSSSIGASFLNSQAYGEQLFNSGEKIIFNNDMDISISEGDISTSQTVAMEVYGENSGIDISYLDYFYVNQTKLENGFSISFDEITSGDFFVNLVNDSGGIVGTSPVYEVVYKEYFNPNIYIVDNLSEGSYGLEVFKNGEKINNGPIYEVPVTSSPIILNVMETYAENGRSAVEGDTQLYFQIEGYGIEDADEILVSLIDSNDTVIAKSTEAKLVEKYNTGKVKCNYKLEVLSGMALVAGESYTVNFESSDEKRIIKDTFINDSYTPNTYETIYDIDIVNGMKGEVSLKLSNIKAGTYSIVFEKKQGWQTIDTIVVNNVDYNGLGVLDLEVKDNKGKPLILNGTYDVIIKEGSNEVAGYYGLAVQYNDDMYGDYYSEMTIIDITPGDLNSSSSGNVEVSGDIANISEGNVTLELVEIDSDGQVLNSAAITDELSYYAELQDSNRYRFGNQYKFMGTINVSGLTEDKKYKWKISGTDINNEDSYFVYPKEILVESSPKADNIRITNGIPLAGGGHDVNEIIYADEYYVSLNEDIRFSIDQPVLMDDLSKISAQILTSNNDVIGILKQGSLDEDDGIIKGEISLNTKLINDNNYELVITYDGIEAGIITAKASNTEGAASISVDEYDDNWVFSSDRDFSFELEDVINLNTSDFKVSLEKLSDGSSPALDVDVYQEGANLVFNCEADSNLSGFYTLSILYNNEPVNLLFYDEWTKELSITGELEDKVIYFKEAPYLVNTEYSGGEYIFNGSGFSSSMNYEAVLFKDSQITDEGYIFNLDYSSSTALEISENEFKGLAKGKYKVYVLENGKLIPSTLDIQLVLASKEANIVQPVVKINNGAESTNSQNVTLNINGGTFTQMKLADSVEALSASEYTSIQGTVEYTLSGGYGENTVYLKFIDGTGLESDVITASIKYISSTLPIPDNYGISSPEMKNGQRITLWIESPYIPAAAEVAFKDDAKTTINTVTLPRTMISEGVNTYSKTITVDETFLGAHTAEFYIKDKITGAYSPVQSADVSFDDDIFIDHVNTNIDMAYLREPHVVTDGEIRLSMVGSLNMKATAKIIYEQEGQEKTTEVEMTESSYSGRYSKNTVVPEGAETIKSIKYKLMSNLTQTSQVYEETINKPVAAALEFTGLDNADGQYNGMHIIIEDKNDNYKRSIKLTGQPRLIFFAVEAGEYNYYLTDFKRQYAAGSIEVSNGKEILVSLENAKQPAELTLNIIGEDVSGYIEYVINSGQEGSRTEYLYIGQKLGGLIAGDNVTCTFRLDYSSLNRYIQPENEEIEITENNMEVDIQLSELEKVTLTGKVLESAVGRDGRHAAIEGATVYLSQEVKNAGTVFFNNESVTTDKNGSFSIIAFKGFEGTLSLRKPGYVDLNADLSESDTNEDRELTDYQVQFRDSKIINVKLLNAPIVEAGETLEYFPSSVERIKDIDVYRGKEKIFNDFDRYNGKLYLYDETLNTGDIITLEAEGRDVIVEGNQQLELNKYLGGEVTFYSKDYGQIKAELENQENSEYMCHMLVFNSEDGKLIKQYSGTGELVTSGSYLTPGDYTAIFLSGKDLTNIDRISTLETINNFDLAENFHYIKQDVQVKIGEYTNLGNITIPNISNEDIGYFNSMGTSINAKIDKVTENGDVRAKVTVKASMLDRFIIDSNKLLSMQVWISGGYVENNEFFLNGKKVTARSPQYMYGANEGERTDATISFYAILSDENNLKINALSDLVIEETRVKADIGRKKIELPALSIKAPEEVVANDEIKILVNGFGYKDSEIEILDNDIVVGKAKVGERGKWESYVNLTNPKETGFHIIKARIIDGEEELLSNLVYTQILSSRAPRLSDITISQGGNFRIRMENVSDSIVDIVATINPYRNIDAAFKILNVEEDNIDYAGLVNDKDGVSTIINAEYNEETGYWEATGKIPNPGDLSIIFALKENMDISYMTGSSPIDVEELPDNADVDPAYLPPEIRGAQVEVTNDGSDGGDIISATATVKASDDKELNITFKGEHTVVNEPPTDIKFIKLETNQGVYYTSAPQVIEYANGDIEIIKTVYFERELFNKIIGEDQDVGLNIPVLENSFNKELFKNTAGNNLFAGATNDLQQYNVAVTTQGVLDKCDYSTYVGGAADFVISTSKNPNALGKLGSAMDVFGGAVLVGQALLGRIGKDPAELRKAASLIKSSSERGRIYRFIDEYANATKNSHYVNTFMGGVSYGASFFGPLGKGLSYVISTGGQVFGKKIGDEYEIWADSIIKMIQVQLTKEKRKIGKKKKISYPKWKIDPSGYVYEAVESNRIENVKATALVKDGEDFRIWNEAEEWDEENPVKSDSEGKYGWDVPEGEWKVRFEKDGYETYVTTSMTVPPLHDQVNIGLLSTNVPSVEDIDIYPDGAEIEFDMYMRPESMDSCIQIKDSDGNNIPISEIISVNPVVNTGYTGEGDYSDITITSEEFSKTFMIVPDTPTGTFNLFGEDGQTAAQYSVIIDKNIASYAGVSMGEEYNAAVAVEERMYYNIVSVDNPNSKIVPVGVSFNSLKLPAYVTVTLDNASTTELLVRWNKDTFNGDNVGNYVVTGDLELTGDLTNTLDIQAAVNIKVKDGSSSTDDDDNNNNNHNSNDNKGTSPEIKVDISTASNGSRLLTSKISSTTINGKTSAVIDDNQINQMISSVRKTNISSIIEFDIDIQKRTKELTTTLSKNGLDSVSQEQNTSMRISTDICKLTFDNNSLKAIKAQTDENISFIMSYPDVPANIKEAVGDRPVISLNIKSGDKMITRFNGGAVNVKIPYSLKDNENANSIVVYYLADNGQLIPVKASGYDSETGIVSFTVKHFSSYAIGYKDVSFNDIDMWAKNSIIYLASRGIVSGSGNGKFIPNKNITRAEFTKMLVEAVDDITINENEKSIFNDVEAGEWYTPYIGWAVENKVVSGYGNEKFGPSENITREQMAVMIDKLADAIELEFPKVKTQQVFADEKDISLWAKNSIVKIQKGGIINGKPGDLFDPKGYATRAEAAKVIEGILNASYTK